MLLYTVTFALVHVTFLLFVCSSQTKWVVLWSGIIRFNWIKVDGCFAKGLESQLKVKEWHGMTDFELQGVLVGILLELLPESWTVRPWKWPFPKGKYRLPTIIFQGRTVKLRGRNGGYRRWTWSHLDRCDVLMTCSRICFLGEFCTDCTMVNHQEKPPFGRICLELFPANLQVSLWNLFLS